MKIQIVEEDIIVFGKEVKTFRLGIEDSFNDLIMMLPAADTRPCYAISRCIDGKVNYKAALPEIFNGEASGYNCERYVIEKGAYLSVGVEDWRQKTDSIRAVFDQILHDDRVDKTSPAVEVYLNDTEMHCMVKIDPLKELIAQFKSGTDTFLATLSSFEEHDINTITTMSHWSAAHVAAHVHLSDKGMTQILNGRRSKTERDPAQHIWQIKAEFLDFNTKNESPDFVRPANKLYNKARLINSFMQGRDGLNEILGETDFQLIYEDFPFPGPDGMSGLELLSFIVYHTERHHQQLINIKEKLAGGASVAN